MSRTQESILIPRPSGTTHPSNEESLPLPTSSSHHRSPQIFRSTRTIPSPPHNPLLPPRPHPRSRPHPTPHPRPIPRQRLQLIVRIHLAVAVRRLHVLLPVVGGGAGVVVGGDVFGREGYGCGFAAEHGGIWGKGGVGGEGGGVRGER